jgi:hypothetical protein
MSTTRNKCRQIQWSDDFDTSPHSHRPSEVQAPPDDGDESSSSSSPSTEEEDQAWTTKNDGGPMKQRFFGTQKGQGKGKAVKRSGRSERGRSKSMGRRRGRGEGRGKKVIGKREIKTPDRQPTRTRIQRSRSNSEPADKPIAKASRKGRQDTKELSSKSKNPSEEAEDEAENEAEEEEQTTRRSRRTSRPPQRFVPDEDRSSVARHSTTKVVDEKKRTMAMVKLENARAGAWSSRQRKGEVSRLRSSSESPDPIGNFDDDTYTLNQAPPDYTRQIGNHDNDETMEVDPIPIPNRQIPTRKGVLKRRHSNDDPPLASAKKKKGVTIDESKNQVRSIKLITSSTSSKDLPPPVKKIRGSNRFGIRSRKRGKDQSGHIIPPRRRSTLHQSKSNLNSLLASHLDSTSRQGREKGEFEVSSDSDPDPELDAAAGGEMGHDNGHQGSEVLGGNGPPTWDNLTFLRALAASIPTSDDESSSLDIDKLPVIPGGSLPLKQSHIRTPTLESTPSTPRARPRAVVGFGLTPVRPRPPSRADELRARAEKEQESQARAEREQEIRARVEWGREVRARAEHDRAIRVIAACGRQVRPEAEKDQRIVSSSFLLVPCKELICTEIQHIPRGFC